MYHTLCHLTTLQLTLLYKLVRIVNHEQVTILKLYKFAICLGIRIQWKQPRVAAIFQILSQVKVSFEVDIRKIGFSTNMFELRHHTRSQSCPMCQRVTTNLVSV